MNDFEPLEDDFCKKCGDTLYWEDCYNCDEGYSDHDCGEDSCNCVNPEPNVVCDICEGNLGWSRCLNKNCK